MPVVHEDKRLQRLGELGISGPISSLSSGEFIHEVFRFRCNAPPDFACRGAKVPSGPEFVPIWECCDTVVGVWEQLGGLDFLEFSIERPEECRVLARTEQGLLASLFVDLYEDKPEWDREKFREPARLIGFLHLDDTIAAYEQGDHGDHTSRERFLEQIVAKIDWIEGNKRR